MNIKAFFDDNRFSTYLDKIKTISSNIFPEEEILVTKAVESRKQEFRAGRIAARKTLNQWNYENFPILIGQDRMPIFPKEITGSISHNKDYVAAISAKKTDIASVGIDIEERHRVTEDLWHIILTENEQEIVKNGDSSNLATLFFSAKEAFFKMQYPLTKQLLDFKNVEFMPDLESKTLKVTKCFSETIKTPHGRYEFFNNNVITLFYIDNTIK